MVSVLRCQQSKQKQIGNYHHEKYQEFTQKLARRCGENVKRHLWTGKYLYDKEYFWVEMFEAEFTSVMQQCGVD